MCSQKLFCNCCSNIPTYVLNSKDDDNICSEWSLPKPPRCVSDVVNWIGCDQCEGWFHKECVRVDGDPLQWFCDFCLN